MVTVDEGLERRVDGVAEWLKATKRLIIVGDGTWNRMNDDLRLLATNYLVRRQLEAIDAALLLTRGELGHMAVGFVRPALDELLWLTWMVTLSRDTAQRLLVAMGRSDATRSLLAQRRHVGDDVMSELWYPVAFLDSVEAGRHAIDQELARARKALSWQGRDLPTARWVAEQTGNLDLYEYLHSATSRALHFSMGEVERNGWGEPGGILTTKKREFRDYRAAFALDQLPKLFIRTSAAAAPLFEGAGMSSDPDLDDEALLRSVELLMSLGTVPLVHAHEWNLTPDGPKAFVERRAG